MIYKSKCEMKLLDPCPEKKEVSLKALLISQDRDTHWEKMVTGAPWFGVSTAHWLPGFEPPLHSTMSQLEADKWISPSHELPHQPVVDGILSRITTSRPEWAIIRMGRVRSSSLSSNVPNAHWGTACPWWRQLLPHLLWNAAGCSFYLDSVHTHTQASERGKR